MFIRVVVVALTVATLWWSSSSFGLGLGLGELKVNSNLASPLKASVTLRGMDGIDLDPEYFSIRIDSDSIPKIEYRLQRMDADTAVIDLYTREIISEPLFQFRIEVKWDSSAVARSYDVLVDPPAYEAIYRADKIGVAGVAESPESGQASEQIDQPLQPPIVLSDVVSDVVASTVTAVTEKLADEDAVKAEVSVAIEPRREYGPIRDGIPIWRVAQHVATDNRELTIYQWMYAIWNTNPRAFIRDNMHGLKMGGMLSIPFEDEVAANTHRVALRVYREQMDLMPTGPFASNTTTGDAPVENEQHNVPQQPVADEIVAQRAEQNVATEVTQVDENALAAEQELDDLAVNAMITGLEQSMSAIDEDAVVARGNNPVVTTAQDAVFVASVTEVEAQQAITVDNSIDISAVENSQVDEAGTSTGLMTAGLFNPDSLDAVTAGNQLSTNIVQQEITAAASAIPVSTVDSDIAGWAVALLSRHEFIDQLPVIGAGGSLAIVGRAVQRADRFVATSPSWAALAFGAWVMLVLMMLRKGFLARRATAGAAELPIAQATASAVAKVTALNQAAAHSADEAAPNSASEERSESVSEERHESASETSSEPSPPLRPSSSNAPEIIAHAKSILAEGNVEEAIKLMRLAVELQPHQPTLVMLLLELYHETRRAAFFAELLDRSISVLKTLKPSDLFRLRTMHAQLCPDAAFSLGQDEVAENNKPPGEDPYEWSPVSDPELILDEQPLFDGVDEVEVSTPDVNAESSSELQHDDMLDLDDAATASGVEIDHSKRRGDRDEVDFMATQVILNDNGVPLREEATPSPGRVGENIDLDVTLKEADVYLAYGLYDNAEELLLKGMEIDPARADFLARLLDCYYATRNIVDFVSSAQVMLDMGDACSEYWEKIEIMGFELAPFNKMFANGKDRRLSTIELEIVKPETADFDLSVIAENNSAAFTDIEIEESSETANADIETYKNGGDNSASSDLNLDLEASELSELSDSANADLDDPVSELEQFLDSEVPDIIDKEGELSIDLEATVDDLDAVLGEGLDAAADYPDTVLVAEYRDEDDADTVPVAETRDENDPDTVLVAEYCDEDDPDTVLVAEIGDEDDVDTVLVAEIGDDDEEDETNLDLVEEYAMQFTMDDDTEFGQNTAAAGDDANLLLVEESALDSPTSTRLDSDNSRILYFPDGSSEGKGIDEFESEVKKTLQAIRDQLQNMTERLFRQERATNDLQQSLAELKDDSNSSTSKKSKKSS